MFSWGPGKLDLARLLGTRNAVVDNDLGFGPGNPVVDDDFGQRKAGILAPLPAQVSNLRPMGCMHPRMAMNVAPHKIINFLKTL